VKYSTDIWHSF